MPSTAIQRILVYLSSHRSAGEGARSKRTQHWAHERPANFTRRCDPEAPRVRPRPVPPPTVPVASTTPLVRAHVRVADSLFSAPASAPTPGLVLPLRQSDLVQQGFTSSYHVALARPTRHLVRNTPKDSWPAADFASDPTNWRGLTPSNHGVCRAWIRALASVGR